VTQATTPMASSSNDAGLHRCADGTGVAVNSADDAYVTASTDSFNFPVTSGAFDVTYNGSRDGFVAKITAGPVLIGPPTDKNQCKTTAGVSSTTRASETRGNASALCRDAEVEGDGATPFVSPAT